MERTDTAIDGVYILKPRVYGDSRGYFFESFNIEEFRRLVPDAVKPFVQDNESRSCRGVVRGLHFQRGVHAQAKLVRVAVGAIVDVAVDIRPGSPTFGQHVAVELNSENHYQLYMPSGMAHGFSVLSDTAIVEYKCDSLYCPEAEGGIAWDDPGLAIDWRLPREEIILSHKDMNRPTLRQLMAAKS